MILDDNKRAVKLVLAACVLSALFYKRCPTCGSTVTRRQIRKRAKGLAR